MVGEGGVNSPRLVPASREYNILLPGPKLDLDQAVTQSPSSSFYHKVSFKPKTARPATEGQSPLRSLRAHEHPAGLHLPYAGDSIDPVDHINMALKVSVPPRLGKSGSPPKPLPESPKKSPVERRTAPADAVSCIVVEYSAENDEVVSSMSRGASKSVLWRHPWALVAAVLKKQARPLPLPRQRAWPGVLISPTVFNVVLQKSIPAHIRLTYPLFK